MTSRREYARLPKPIAADYTVPGGTVCIQVKCPDSDAHVALLQGLMAKLTDAAFWQGDDVDRPIMAGLWQEAYVETDWSNCMDPALTGAQDNLLLFHVHTVILAGNGLAFVATNQSGGYALQNPAAINNAWKHTGIRLRPGQYRCSIFFVKTNASGILDLNLINTGLGSDVFVAATDMYASSSQFNQLDSTAFNVDEDSEFELVGVMSTKNPSSSNYQCLLTSIAIQRTGDL